MCGSYEKPTISICRDISPESSVETPLDMIWKKLIEMKKGWGILILS